MRFNGKDLLAVHKAVSICKEIPPGMPRRSITTVETTQGETITNAQMIQEEFTVRVNIAARSCEEAMQAREKLAQWACSSGDSTAALEPTRTPGKAYDAIVKSISKIEQRFGTVDVVFLLPKPVMHDTAPSSVQSTGNELQIMIGGTAKTQPEIHVTPKTDALNLTITLNGEPLLGITGMVRAGTEMVFTPETGALTIGGAHAESRINYLNTDPDIELAPGRHKYSCSANGLIEARWRNKWL